MQAARRPVAFISILLVLSSLYGCQSGFPKPNFNPIPARDQAEAGSSHVAVLSVADWEDYVQALQPTFQLTPDQARAQAAASTRALQEGFLDAMRLGLSVRTPQSTDSRTRTTTRDAAGNRTSTETRTEQDSPADLADISTGTGLTTDLAAEAPDLPTAPGVDPILQHSAATALYQEVQLLNRYVHDAAKRTGTKPYVVRLQLSVHPSSRNRAYDTYANIGFFGRWSATAKNSLAYRISDRLAVGKNEWGKLKEEEAPGAETTKFEAAEKTLIKECTDLLAGKPVIASEEASEETVREASLKPSESPVVPLAYTRLMRQTLDQAGAERSSENPQKTPQEAPQQGIPDPKPAWPEAKPEEYFASCLELTEARSQVANPEIIPLLVTDDLESTIHSRTLDQIRQLSFSLLFLIQNVGGLGEFDRFRENLQTTLGTDLNSLMTVARISDNMYRVRLGAMQQVQTSYAMVPRTYNLTLLLLAPCDLVFAGSRRVDVMARTDLQSVDTGARLPSRPDGDLDLALEAIQNRYQIYGLDPSLCHLEELEKLWGSVQRNNGVEFFQQLRGCLKTIGSTVCHNRTSRNRRFGRSDCVPTVKPEEFPRQALWVDLASLLVGGHFSSTSFELPIFPGPNNFPSAQNAVLFDDGEKGAVTILRDGKDLRQDRLSAHLAIDDGGSRLEIPAERIDVLDNGTRGRFSFPSPTAWGRTENSMTLQVHCEGCGQAYDDFYCTSPASQDAAIPVSVLRKKATPQNPEPGFTVEVRPAFLRADKDGKGALNLVFTRAKTNPATKMFFKVTGADIDTALCPGGVSCPDEEGAKTLNTDGSVRVTLMNLTSIQPVKVIAFSKKGEVSIPHAPITVSVLP